MKVDAGSTATYVYDALNHRVRTQDGSSTNEYLYDPSGRRISTWVASNNYGNEGRIYWGTQQLGFRSSDGTTYFDHQDWTGTERARTNCFGTTSALYASFVYGDDSYAFNIQNANSGYNQDNAIYAGLDYDAGSGALWSGSTYLPRSPVPAEGRIYPRGIHGVTVYQTLAERNKLDFLLRASTIVSVIGFTWAIIEEEKWKRSHPRVAVLGRFPRRESIIVTDARTMTIRRKWVSRRSAARKSYCSMSVRALARRSSEGWTTHQISLRAVASRLAVLKSRTLICCMRSSRARALAISTGVAHQTVTSYSWYKLLARGVSAWWAHKGTRALESQKAATRPTCLRALAAIAA